MQQVKASTSLAFVYGTLKRGYYNCNAYLKAAVDNGHASFVSNGRTVNRYRFVVGHERSIPFLLANDDVAHADTDNYEKEGVAAATSQSLNHILGEIFAIHTRSVIQGLDLVEGVHTGFYLRECVPVEEYNNNNSGSGSSSLSAVQHDCLLYVKNTIDHELLKAQTTNCFGIYR